MKDLIKRLETAEHGSRELDAELAQLAYAEFLAKCERVDDPDRELGWKWVHPIDGLLSTPEYYTTDLSAAVALVERVLPEMYLTLSGPRKYLNIPSPVPNHWLCILSTGRPGEFGVDERGWGATAPLALVIALLKALEAKEAP